jgi:hypothetical protein
MTLDITIYSHDKKAITPKDIKRIREVVERAKGYKVRACNVVATKEVPKLTSAGRIDWGWFKKTLTDKDPDANVIAFHFTKKLKKKWGVLKDINGSYQNDPDGVLEFWFAADKNKKPGGYKTGDTEVSRLLAHELLHGLYRKGNIPSDYVHLFDYDMKDVAMGYYLLHGG